MQMKRKFRNGLALLSMLCMIVTLCQSNITVFATEASSVTSGTDGNGFTVDNTGALVSYTGVGGDITVPSTATSISSNVFAGNTAITSVTIPASVAVMGTGIFTNCTSLTSVTIQGNISSIPSQTFLDCENLKSVYVPASVTSIEAEAFSDCVSLSGITIPSGVATIGEKAFYGCASLTGVSIPAAVSSIGNNAFSGSTNLTAYTVESANAYYSSYNGCLYNKSMTKLLSCPEGRSSAQIADGTKIIGSYSFYNCVAINSLTLPSTITTIESDAFTGSGIKDITILSGVTSIGVQSSWIADVIYGENDSTAETYAASNDIVFQAVSSSANSDSTDTESGNTGTEVVVDINGNNTAGNNTAGNNAGTTTNSGTVSTTAASTTNAAIGANTSGATAVAAAHEKDATPKTGDGINPIFFFCIAVLLLGIYLFMSGKKRASN